MSFFSRIMNKVYESVVEDEFTQPLTDHQVLSVINREKHPSNTGPDLLRRAPSTSNNQILQIVESISQSTPEIQFRLLGYDPKVEEISIRVTDLKKKLQIVESHLLENSQQYINTINRSLFQLQDLRQFYSGRMKGQQLRRVLSKLKIVMDCGKKITRLNILAKNLKDTLKVLQRIPNIKKMNLIELKSINCESLQKLSSQMQLLSPKRSKLLCIDNLYNYITKVNNEEFIYIIDKLKICFEAYDPSVYEEVIRNYIVITPNTSLEKLICSLLQQKIRSFYDSNIEKIEQISRMGQKIIVIITNLHKLIKWHRVNKALRCTSKHSSPHKIQTQEDQIRNRCLSVDSVLSEEGKINIELTDIVFIDSSAVKSTLSKTIDACLADMISDHVLVDDLSFSRFYEYCYLISRISEICYNFTGVSFDKLRKLLVDYCSKRQYALYIKNARELISSLQFQKNDWNRLPFYNNYRSKGLDKYMFRAEKMKVMEQFRRVEESVSRLFQPKQRDMTEVKRLLKEEEEEEDECLWELNPVKLPSFQKIEKNFEGWQPDPSYLGFNDGDAILCQSSFKLLSTLQKYFQFLLFVPRNELYNTYITHILILIQFYMFYLFNTFLTPTYKNLFYQQYNRHGNVDRKYTKKRLIYLYPALSKFVQRFKKEIEKTEPTQQSKFYVIFRKDIIQIKGENNQILKAKIIATQSCKFVIAYVDEMIKRLTIEKDNNQLYSGLADSKAIISQLSTILLTESSQKMVGLQLETMRSLFQTIRWHQNFEDLKDYIAKIAGLIRQSYQRLKSSNRGEIPTNIIYRIFVLLWRTLVTYAIKLFLQGKANSKRQSKLNFQKFIEEMYINFNNTANKQLSQLEPAYKVFKSIFPVLLCTEWEQCKQVLLATMKKYDYIFQILMALLDNCEYMQGLSEKDKEFVRIQLKEDIIAVLDEGEK